MDHFTMGVTWLTFAGFVGGLALHLPVLWAVIIAALAVSFLNFLLT